jgi:predicted enzyme related to lactoylglutathione lyase
VFKRALPGAALLAMALLSISAGCRSASQAEPTSEPTVHYLEIVSTDVDAVTGLYERTCGLSFGPPDPDLGQARVATRPDGTLVGIRAPLAEHEQSIVRTYLAVDDIQRAVKKAEEHGAIVAYPPTAQGKRGTFAIVVQGGVQHGLWQP